MSDCTPDSPWRATGDTTCEAFAAELAGSPVAAEADVLCDTASPYGRLYLAHSKAENQHDTVGILISPEMHNNLALRPRGYPEEVGFVNGFACFASYADCLAAWRRRLLAPDLGYVGAVTLLEYCEVYNPEGDTHPITGVPNKPEVYCQRLLETINRLPLDTEDAMPELNMTKGLIPLPPVVQKIIGYKPEGVGWDDLGPRTVRGFVLHRMQGTLRSTYDHFSNPSVGALTDYGCDHETGEVWLYNDPKGRRSGWASGRVSAPYGDGKAFLDKYGPLTGIGLNVVNRDQVSWELSGFFAQPGSNVTREDPWLDKSIRASAQACAHYAHDYGIPWTSFPIAPQDGFSFVRWHQEFTIGTGKVCPGKAVMDLTDDFIGQTKEIMRRYQTGEVNPPPPAEYVPLDPPWTQLDPDGPWNGSDRRLGKALLFACRRQFTARKRTPVYRYSDRTQGEVRAPLAVGETFNAEYWTFFGNEPWVVTDTGARVPVKDSTPKLSFELS